MDATDLLRRDHDGVRGLFQAFENAGDRERSRRELFEQIREAIDVHARVEEEIFYPAVRAAGDEGADIVEDATEEHDAVNELLETISALDPSERKFERTLRKLRRKVEHHATEEEAEMFPFAREHLGGARLEELGARLEARKKELSPRDPHAQVR
jgi:hemerythrin superfamily protein